MLSENRANQIDRNKGKLHYQTERRGPEMRVEGKSATELIEPHESLVNTSQRWTGRCSRQRREICYLGGSKLSGGGSE